MVVYGIQAEQKINVIPNLLYYNYNPACFYPYWDMKKILLIIPNDLSLSNK